MTGVFPGDQVVKTLRFCCRVCGFDAWSGNLRFHMPGDAASCHPTPPSSARKKKSMTVVLFYYCVINYHKLSGLKQQTFIII